MDGEGQPANRMPPASRLRAKERSWTANPGSIILPAMSPAEFFPEDYRSGRSAFRAAAANAGARLATYDAPSTGPDGAPLHTDVAILGRDDAPRVLLCNSATHGVEGFCGSGVFTGWLRNAPEIPQTVKVVLIHALNCHGFAWLRRTTEENVDLNRNFVDHAAGLPRNAEYAELHSHLLPDRWNEQTVAALKKTLEGYVAERSFYRLQCVLTGGQYDRADGIFFGGREPATARERFLKIVEDHAAGARHVLFLDWHTGLGPYGTAELIGMTRPGSPHGDRVNAWFLNGLTSASDGSSSSAPVTGTIGSGLRRRLAGSGTEITSLTVEFGTYPPRDVLMALIADNWLHAKGDPESALGREIKKQVRRALYPDEDDWKELVWVRGRQLMRRSVEGLSGL